MHGSLALAAVAALAASFLPTAVAAAPAAGSLIRGTKSPAVYYVGGNGKRYVFPNGKTYATWYADFSSVETVSDYDLSSLPIGGNVTYRPGTRLVKIQSDPRVYAVEPGGRLRWVASEGVAAALWGTGWATRVDDVSDAFFVNYVVAADLAAPSYPAGSLVRAADGTAWYVDAAARRRVTTEGFAAQRFREEFVAAAAEPPALPAGADIVGGERLSVLDVVEPYLLPPPIQVGTVPQVGRCAIFPADNPWNQDVSGEPVDPHSATYIAAIGLTGRLHPDFGNDPAYGIPYSVVSSSQPPVPITFDAYGDESDPGPYPIPANASVEAGSDRHVIALDKDACRLYELYDARKDAEGDGWTAASGAVFDLTTNTLRPDGWTSADAAGLPIYPGLVKYEEVASGEIRHALRFTAARTQNGHVPPATHHAGADNPYYAPMGLRVRLKASYDLSGYSGQARVILAALKKYGMILADNGSSWYVTGAPDPRWDGASLETLKDVPGSAFEAIATGPILQ